MNKKKWKGTLRRGLVGPGFWKLDADDGRSYQLVGDVPASLEGQRVQIKGDSSGLLGIAALAGVIRVEQIKPLRGTLGDL